MTDSGNVFTYDKIDGTNVYGFENDFDLNSCCKDGYHVEQDANGKYNIVKDY